MRILNLTQHESTLDQRLDGVFDLGPEDRKELHAALTIDAALLAEVSQDTQQRILINLAADIVAEFVTPIVAERAREILERNGFNDVTPRYALSFVRPEVAADDLCAMIGGAPYLMGHLAAVLHKVGVRPLFALSDRVSEEVPLSDGTVKKVSVFRHLGFVDA